MTAEIYASVAGFFGREPRSVLVDVADILIVAFVIYRVLALLRGTRAMQMAIGLVLVFVLYQVARDIGLITLWTMMDAALTYVVLIVVILFQNDIRRALMRVGRRPFLRSARAARETQLIEEVVRAAMALAERRIGALIVFERDAMLDEFVELGTELDAAVSKELLFSVFLPSFENPMHDGAVILREGRVWQAGAFLPLTGSPRVDKAFGTRHRAAIGISEETDAVVVVVSEERGEVSLCFNGNVVRNLDAASLREAILGLFYRRPKRRTARGTAGEAPGRASAPPSAPGTAERSIGTASVRRRPPRGEAASSGEPATPTLGPGTSGAAPEEGA